MLTIFLIQLVESYLAPSSPWDSTIPGVEPLPDTLVLNNQATYNCSIASTTLSYHTSSQPACTGGAPHITTIRPNSTLRLRLINHSAYLSYWFHIDDHTLTIVEIDGVEIEPFTASGVHVNIGQRYSVLVTADPAASPGSAYTIRSSLERKCFLPYSTYISEGLAAGGYEARGVLLYEDVDENDDLLDKALATINANADTAATAEANTNPYDCKDLPFSTLTPQRAEPAYELAPTDPRYMLDFEFRQAGAVNRIFLNRTSWAPYQDDATLWQAVEAPAARFAEGEGGGYNNWGFRLDQQVLLVPDGSDVVQLAVNSLDAMEHPFHMQ